MATDTQTMTELPDDATHEEIEGVVDQIIADRVADEPPGESSDAEKVGSGKAVTQRDTEDTADGDNRTMSYSDSETTGDGKPAKEKSDWREDAISEASAYGIGEDELADFTSREELDRALKLFDRQLDTEREKVLDSSESDDEDQDEPEEGKRSSSEDGRADESAYEIQLDKDIYDEELVDEFTRMRDHYEDRIAAIEERFTNADALAAEERFDRNVEELEFSQLFGKTGEESDDELKRRKELYDRVQVEQLVMSRLGRNVDEYDYAALVRRVARSNFPDEYDKRLIKNRTRKVSRQSNSRQGGGVTRPTDPPEDWREEVIQHHKELDQLSG